jgi:hypothetical protein
MDVIDPASSRMTLDPTKDYQTHRRPKRPYTDKGLNLKQVQTYSDVPRHRNRAPGSVWFHDIVGSVSRHS